MSKKKNDYKTWGLVGAAVVALIIVVIAIMKFGMSGKITSSYFHDADGKTVMTMDRNASVLQDDDYQAFIIHTVYLHDNKKVTNMRIYYEYATEDEAKEALENLETPEFVDDMWRSGRFVAFQVSKDEYDGMTVEQMKENVELLKEMGVLMQDYDENTIKQYGSVKVEPQVEETSEESLEETSEEIPEETPEDYAE